MTLPEYMYDLVVFNLDTYRSLECMVVKAVKEYLPILDRVFINPMDLFQLYFESFCGDGIVLVAEYGGMNDKLGC
jgi:hypothetical protein